MTAVLMIAAGILMAADTAQDEAKRLEGTWTIVGVEIEGKPIPAEQVAKRKETLTFQGGKVTVSNARPSKNTVGYKIDATKSPKALDLNGPGDDPATGRAFIYELKGDTLRLCQGKQGNVRPKAFPTEANPEGMVMTLTRQKP